MYEAAMVGVRRHIQALFRGLPDRYGADPENGWTIHIEGACGEAAAAKALGIPYVGTVGTFKNGTDVGGFQVRTRRLKWHELNIRKGDRSSDNFILVTGKAPHFNVVGWIRGRHAKRERWLHAHGGRTPAYFVPHSHLRPVRRMRKS